MPVFVFLFIVLFASCPAAAEVVRLSPPDPVGGIRIDIHPAEGKMEPAAEALLTDPSGRKAGIDPASGRQLKEIPNSYYEREGLDDDETGEPGPASAILDVVGPAEGDYILRVTGTEDGSYDMEAMTYDADHGSSYYPFLKVPIKKGKTHIYAFTYRQYPGGQIPIKRVK